MMLEENVQSVAYENFENILYVRLPKGASGRELMVRTDEAVDDVEETVQQVPTV